MQKSKYVLNKNSGTLHKINGCRHSNVYKDYAEYFQTEDEAIAHGTRYFKHCKLCFGKEE